MSQIEVLFAAERNTAEILKVRSVKSKIYLNLSITITGNYPGEDGSLFSGIV